LAVGGAGIVIPAEAMQGASPPASPPETAPGTAVPGRHAAGAGDTLPQGRSIDGSLDGDVSLCRNGRRARRSVYVCEREEGEVIL